MERKEISKSVLKRLPGYLAYLKSIPEGASAYISATALANALGMGEVQVRKDLASVSDGGRPKIGYLRESLIEDIEQFLGYDNTTDAVLIGAGRLGQALATMFGFGGAGFINTQTRIMLVNNIPLLLLCIMGSTPIPRILGEAFGLLCADKNPGSPKQKLYVAVTYVFCVILLILSTISLVGSGFSAFLYYRF